MLEKQKLFIILNPIAGKGKAADAYPKIKSHLEKASSCADFEIVQTESQGHALELAKNVPEGWIAVAAGGDGTCNEVVNGLLSVQRESPPIFGLLPVGRGNDFAYSAQVPNALEKALDLLLEGSLIPLDVGRVKGGFFPEGRYFVNGVGIGFDTKVGFEAAKMNLHSSLGYVLGAIITVAKFEPSPILEVRHDSKSFIEAAAIVSVVNGRRMGGTFMMGPKALINDGQLDFCTIRHPRSRRRLLFLVMQYPKGNQIKYDECTYGRASHFILTAHEGGMSAHCDGETICYDGKELSIECVPKALQLVSKSIFVQ